MWVVYIISSVAEELAIALRMRHSLRGRAGGTAGTIWQLCAGEYRVARLSREYQYGHGSRGGSPALRPRSANHYGLLRQRQHHGGIPDATLKISG